MIHTDARGVEKMKAPPVVVSIRGENYATPDDCTPLADDLRRLAENVDKGELPALRAILIYETTDKRIGHIALGEPITLLEACGFAAWTIEASKGK